MASEALAPQAARHRPKAGSAALSIRLAGMMLLVFVLAIYLQTFGASFYSIDEEIYLRTTQSIVERGTFAITPIEYAPNFSVARGTDGLMYANRGPGYPIVTVPFYLLGKALTSLGTPRTTPALSGIDDPTVFTLSLTLANTLIVSATVWLLFVTLVRLGYDRRASAAVALLLAFGTMAWSYASKSYFAEPLLALTSLSAFYFALRYRQDGRVLMLLGAGALLGWGVLTKVTAFALLPPMAAYAVWPEAGRPQNVRKALIRLAWLAAGVAPFAVAWVVHNYMRFGNPFSTGYELEGGSTSLVIGEPALFLQGLFGLLFSTGKGLLFYATPVLLGLWAAPRFWRAHRAESVFVYGAGAATVAGVALWRDWSGGWCWGPRLVLNVVPLLMIPAAAVLSSSRRTPGRGLWWAIGGLALFSFATQFLGALPSYLKWYQQVGNYDLVYFSPMHSPIVGHWLAVTSGKIDVFWDKVDLFFPGRLPFFTELRWTLFGITAVAGWALWHIVRKEPEPRL